MAAYDNTYSRIVAWLKVVLPLAALVILSTLFLVSQKHDPGSALPYSDVEVDEILREQSILAPNYAGVTNDGTSITLAADTARPETADRVAAEVLHASIRTPDGGVMDLSASSATVDTSGRSAKLSGGVHIETSTGYVLDSDTITASLHDTHVETEGAVQGHAPMGRLNAGKMILRGAEAGEDAAYVLLFTGGVDLIYQPTTSQGGQP